jgi:hypothetical protein
MPITIFLGCAVAVRVCAKRQVATNAIDTQAHSSECIIRRVVVFVMT